MSEESMVTYYYAKLAVCNQCEVIRDRATSCINRGLSTGLQESASAYNAKTARGI